MTAEGIICLENQMVRVTPPNDFNDPFEFIPKIVDSASREETISYLMKDEILAEYYCDAINRKITTESFEDFKNDILDNIEDYTDSIINHSSKSSNKWKLAKEFLDDVSKLITVYCLSKKGDNLLMWSHYAAYHTGIVIGLNTDDSFFETSNGVYDVHYVNDRPVYSQSWLDYSAPENQFITDIISHKNKIWSYEEETRIIFNIERCKKIEVNKNELYLKEFSPNLISEVIIGCRCSNETIRKVKTILRNEIYSHTVLKKAYLDSKKYRLNIRKINK